MPLSRTQSFILPNILARIVNDPIQCGALCAFIGVAFMLIHGTAPVQYACAAVEDGCRFLGGNTTSGAIVTAGDFVNAHTSKVIDGVATTFETCHAENIKQHKATQRKADEIIRLQQASDEKTSRLLALAMDNVELMKQITRSIPSDVAVEMGPRLDKLEAVLTQDVELQKRIHAVRDENAALTAENNKIKQEINNTGVFFGALMALMICAFNDRTQIRQPVAVGVFWCMLYAARWKMWDITIANWFMMPVVAIGLKVAITLFSLCYQRQRNAEIAAATAAVQEHAEAQLIEALAANQATDEHNDLVARFQRMRETGPPPPEYAQA